MRQVVEMGSACGPIGCVGEIAREYFPETGQVRCRDETGQFTACPPELTGGSMKGGSGMIGQVRRYPRRYPRRRMGQGFGPEAFEFSPFMVEPTKVVIGNIAGGFIPTLVGKGMERANVSEKTQGLVQFLLGLSGVGGFLFARKNPWVFGFSLAMIPSFVEGVSTFAMGLFMPKKPAASPPKAEEKAAVGQVSESERAALERAMQRAFGPAGASRSVGQLEPTGFEAVVPSDYEALAEASTLVSAVGQPIGMDVLRPLGT